MARPDARRLSPERGYALKAAVPACPRLARGVYRAAGAVKTASVAIAYFADVQKHRRQAMQTKPILVTGATGKTGARVAARLTALGRVVRPGSRRAAIPFDWSAPDSWGPALEGVEAAYLAYHPDLALPGAVDTVAGVAEAARAAGVNRVVLLSGRGEANAQRAEAAVQASGVDYTLVRAAWFAQNFSEGALRGPVLEGVLPMPGGDVREPIIDVADIADVAVAALTDPRHAGALYEVTGPRLMGFAEMAGVLSEAMGRKVTHQSISFDAFRAGVAETSGAMIADIITAIARETLDGRNAVVMDGVAQALGRPPRDFRDFAHDAARAGAWRVAA